MSVGRRGATSRSGCREGQSRGERAFREGGGGETSTHSLCPGLGASFVSLSTPTGLACPGHTAGHLPHTFPAGQR